MLSEEFNLKFEKEITRWDEGIPLGNGLMGALIWGNGEKIRISLDRADLWDVTPTEEVLEEGFTFNNLLKAIKEKDERKIMKKFDRPYDKITPTKIPAGAIEFFLNSENFNGELDLNAGEAFIKTENVFLQAFMHATKKVGCIKVKGNFDFKLAPHDFSNGTENIQANSLDTGSLKNLKYPKYNYSKEENIEYIIQPTKNEFTFGIFVGSVKKSEITELAFYVGCSNDGENWIKDSKDKIKEALNSSYDEYIKSHKKWWDEFWNKSSMTLCNKELEKMWYVENYLFGSTSRKGCPPMSLQGVWTADDGKLPPWKGDYHNDLNTQLSYLHYLKSNHLEEGESFLDFLFNLMDKGREHSKKFFETEGLCFPGVMAIDGTPLCGWAQYSLSITSHIWLTQMFHSYYKYTGDLEFLRKKAYPFLKESANCLLGIMKEKDGKLVLPISSSPEIHNNSMNAWFYETTNYDLSIIIYLFKSLIEESQDLGFIEEKNKWEGVFFKLPKLSLSEAGTLNICGDEPLKESHRHHSNLIGIYPLQIINYEDKNWKETIKKSINYNANLGFSGWTGYSLGWMAALYAMIGEGERAEEMLQYFWRCTCSINGFHLNGDYKNQGILGANYRPFTLEGNMCSMDALQEMLMQSYDETIRVFPAIPKKWREEGATFKNFRGENGIIVSSSITNYEVEYIKLKSEKGGCYKVKNSFSKEYLTVTFNNKKENIGVPLNSVFKVELNKDEECIITMVK